MWASQRFSTFRLTGPTGFWFQTRSDGSKRCAAKTNDESNIVNRSSKAGSPSLGISPLNALIGTIAIMTFASGLARASAAADPPDPKPPQVSVDFLFPPSPLIQSGKPRLVYEMRITNYVPLIYTLDAIEVHAGSKTFNYAGETLRQMTRFLGEQAQTAATLKIRARTECDHLLHACVRSARRGLAGSNAHAAFHITG
jgi:hypothetical protein